MGNRSWIVPVSGKKHFDAIIKEFEDVQEREGVEWCLFTNCLVVLKSPLVFDHWGHETLGTLNNTGEFAYLLFSSDGSGWTEFADSNILGESRLLEELLPEFGGRTSPIKGGKYMNGGDMDNYLVKTDFSSRDGSHK